MAKNDKKHDKAQDELTEEELRLQAQAQFDAVEGETVVGSGFPPYLKPEVNGLYYFTPISTDARNPKFVRHTVTHDGPAPIICRTGPVDDAEPVEVKPGEAYSISDYKGIPFDDLMGLKVTAICDERRKMPNLPDGSTRAPMFIFRFKLSAKDKAIFEERKKTRMLADVAAMRRNALETANAHANGAPAVTAGGTIARQGNLAGVAG